MGMSEPGADLGATPMGIHGWWGTPGAAPMGILRIVEDSRCSSDGDMKRFLTRVKKKLSGSIKLTGQKQTGTVFEARERADFNCLAGAGGPESIWSVVEAPKPGNGTPKSSISIGFIRFSAFVKTRCENLLYVRLFQCFPTPRQAASPDNLSRS